MQFAALLDAVECDPAARPSSLLVSSNKAESHVPTKNSIFEVSQVTARRNLTGYFAEKLLLVHAVLEGFASVDEHDRDLVVILAAEIRVGIDIHVAPFEPALPMKFHEAFLDDFAEMAAFSRIDGDQPLLHSQCSVAVVLAVSNTRRA